MRVTSANTTYIDLPELTVTLAKKSVINNFVLFLCIVEFFLFEKIMIKQGRRINDVKNNVVSPRTIIYPKSMTGLISLNINDANATIVVSAVYRHGHIIF